MSKQLILSFSFKSTPIQTGEYGAAFGQGRKPIDIIKIYLFMGKHMAIEEETDTSIRVTCVGALPKRTRDGLSFMQRTRLIYDFREQERNQEREQGKGAEIQ